jgi:hypothetical protein
MQKTYFQLITSTSQNKNKRSKFNFLHFVKLCDSFVKLNVTALKKNATELLKGVTEET